MSLAESILVAFVLSVVSFVWIHYVYVMVREYKQEVAEEEKKEKQKDGASVKRVNKPRNKSSKK